MRPATRRRTLRRAAPVATGALLAGAVLVGAGMRLVPDDPAVWHVDPAEAQRTGAPNDYLVAPEGLASAEVDRPAEVFPEAPDLLMARFDAVAADAGARRIAGRPEALWATYVDRSAVFGFPDYVSVRAVQVPGGSALVVWSRSRFGHSDLGVNEARVEGWLSELSAGG